MVREFSAGGVVVRRMNGRWWMAAIEPQRERLNLRRAHGRHVDDLEPRRRVAKEPMNPRREP